MYFKFFFSCNQLQEFRCVAVAHYSTAINMTWVIFITIMALYQQLLEIGKGIDHIWFAIAFSYAQNVLDR